MKTERLLQTPFGLFCGVTTADTDPTGAVCEMRLDEKNVILTHAGELIPFYDDASPRRKYKPSVTFHQNGMIRAVSLNEQQEIRTPIGEFPAELVTFYETGELKRFFPLDGKISGFWSEEDERSLNIPFQFELEFASFSALLSGVYFYRSGAIKSITLFPGEVIEATVGGGTIKVRNGFSLFENGSLRTLEPAVPTQVKTPVGTITAYDVSANGITADTGSLRLDEQGRITGIVTSSDKIAVQSGEKLRFFTPGKAADPLDETKTIVLPVALRFDYETNRVEFTDAEGANSIFDINESAFYIYAGDTFGCNPKDCAGCSGCSL